MKSTWRLEGSGGRVLVMIGAQPGAKAGAGVLESNFDAWLKSALHKPMLFEMYESALGRTKAAALAKAGSQTNATLKAGLKEAFLAKKLTAAVLPREAQVTGAPRAAAERADAPSAKRIVSPVIALEAPAVLVKKAYTSPKRKEVSLTTDIEIGEGGKGTFTCASKAIAFYTEAGKKIAFNGDHVFSAKDLNAGVALFAEGVSPSASEDDIELRLALSGGPDTLGKDAVAKMTSVEVFLDICKSRASKDADPEPLSEDEKTKTGRFVHVQSDARHGRALAVVRRAKPADFSKKLVLRSSDGHRLSILKKEVAAKGDKGSSEEAFPNKGIDVTSGEKRWIQGESASKKIGDIALQLGLEDEADGDRAVVTVVRFSSLTAFVARTPSKRSPEKDPERWAWTAGGLSGAHPYDDADLGQNPPLALLTGAVPAGDTVLIETIVEPKGAKVAWHVARHVGPEADHADVVALSPSATPTLTSGSDPTTATLLADAVGTFHVRAYVDCNGSGQYEYGVDREPHIVMNVVMVHAAISDISGSKARSDLFNPWVFRDDKGTPTGICRFSSGWFDGTKGDADEDPKDLSSVTFDASVDLVGGGPKGLLGLDRVSLGWINNERTSGPKTAAHYKTGDGRKYAVVAAWVDPGKPATSAFGGARLFEAWSSEKDMSGPFLDCIAPRPEGGLSLCLRHQTVSLEKGPSLGERRRAHAVDAPYDGATLECSTPVYGKLRRLEMELAFSAYLAAWTNNAGPLYGVLAKLDWDLSARWAIQHTPAVTAALDLASPPKATLTRDASISSLVPASQTALEVKGPTSLQVLAKRATNPT